MLPWSLQLESITDCYWYTYTGCPINMLTSSDSILQILKPHVSKNKTCFKIGVKKAFRWHLETWENQIERIFILNVKKKCQIPKKNPNLFPPVLYTVGF